MAPSVSVGSGGLGGVFVVIFGHPTMHPTPGMVLPFIDLLQCVGVK